MIDLADLRKEDIGKWVLYDDNFKKEKGRIKSWNAEYIFVVYKCDGQWDRFQDFTGCATNPEDLRFTTLKEVV
jgi:major membrane immunogen (membrane-anchored lipoprotein)